MEHGSPSARNSQVDLSKEKEKLPTPTIDIQSPPRDAWVIEIKEIKEKLGVVSQEDTSASWENVCIYRVPDHLKQPFHHKPLTPRVVSLGPYYHGITRVQKMERHKWRLLHHVLDRTGQDIELYFDAMKTLEKDAKTCYDQLSELVNKNFVKMILLDGCFILEILRGLYYGHEKFYYAKDDPVFSEGTLWSIRQDMLMLENQVPLFVLDKLFALQPRKNDEEESFIELVNYFFGNLMPSMGMALEGLHCLDVVRNKCLKDGPKVVVEDGAHQNLIYGFTKLVNVAIKLRYAIGKKNLNGASEPVRENKRRQQLNYCATELKNAGIKLRKKNNDNSLLDIEFMNGILYIPEIPIDDGFKSLFFNLIAFEQCHVDFDKQHITTYVGFLDDLIDSPEDVRYLKNRGIIKHMVGSDTEVANLINNLCYGAIYDIDNNYLSHLSWKINNYRNQRWNIWRATLKERYFGNPWAIISFVAGVFLLLMTATQTFYAVYSYNLPNN